MYLMIEPSVLKMIPFNISLSSEKWITDDNVRKKLGEELRNYRYAICMLGVFLKGGLLHEYVRVFTISFLKCKHFTQSLQRIKIRPKLTVMKHFWGTKNKSLSK